MRRKLRKFAAIIFTAILTFSTVGNNALTVFAADEALFEEVAAQAEAEAQAAAEAAAKAEEERLAQEQAAEAERLAAEQAAKAEAERIAQEQAAEAERLAQEQAAAEAAAKAEAERIAQEQAAAEAAAKAEAEAKAAAEAEAKAAAEAEAKAAAEAEAKAAKEEEEKAAAEEEEASEEETEEDAEEEEEKAEPEVTEEDFTVTITYEASEGGSVSVEEETLTWKKITTIDENGKKTVETEPANVQAEGATAKADEDYEFRGWTLDGKTVSEKETFVPSVPEEDTTYKAQFLSKDGDFPAQSFKGETADVSVSASVDEGVFPEGTEMKVAAVAKQVAIDAAQEAADANTEIVDAVAVDITFHHDGKEIQPQGAVNVRLTAKRKLAGENHEAITIDGSGNAETVASATARSSSFDTDHFTVYGIAGGNYTDDDVEEYIRHTYIFYVGDYEDPTNNTVKVDEVIVHNGDTLTVPADPAGDVKHSFAGWYKADEEGKLTEEKVDSDSGAVIIDPATKGAAEAKNVTAEDRIIKVYAKFDTQYTVTLYADAGKEKVFDTKAAANGKTVEIPTPKDATTQGLIVPAGEKMTGWKYARDDGETVKGNSVMIDGVDIELVPVFASSHNVKFVLIKEVFDAIPEQNVLDGDKVEKPTQYVEGETYKGYEFGGWYTEEAFKDEFDFNKELEEGDGDTEGNIVLYAKWIPAEVNYTIEVWLESAHVDEPEFQQYGPSIEIKGESDSPVPVSDILNDYKNDKYKSETPGFFHWSGNGKVNGSNERAVVEVVSDGKAPVEYGTDGNPTGGTEATISPDGTTVVRIYYCRDTYHVHFLFADNKDDVNNKIIAKTESRIDGYSVGSTLNEYGKSNLPEGVDKDVSLPVIQAKYREYLYEAAYITNPGHGDLFDAFLGDKRWFFKRIDFNGSGQTVFNESNMTSPVKPNKDPGDDGDLYVLLYMKSGQKTYVYQNLYYDKVYTQDDIRSGKIEPVTEGKPIEIVYTTEGAHGHAHNFEIGRSEGGYTLVDVTGHYGVKVDGVGEIRRDNPKLGKGTHKYYWVNGEDPSEDKPVEYIYHHLVPEAYNITFKQTKNAGYVNGEKISADSKKDDVTIEGLYYGSDIANILDDVRVPAWSELTDDRGVVYARNGSWLGDDIGDDGSLPKIMPAHDMVFYLDWTAASYTVFYDLNYDKKVERTDGLAWGVRVPDPAEKGYDKREGWTLLGWEAYELDRDDDGKRVQGQRIGTGYFTFNTPVKQDLYLKAVWEKPGGYQVVYQKGLHGTIDGEDENGEKKDPQTYASNAHAPVKYIATPDEGFVFTGWAIGGTQAKKIEEDGSKVYYGSGDVFGYTEAADMADGEKDSVLTLVAQYAKIERLTDVTYHTNFPEGSGRTERETTLKKVAVWNDGFIVSSPDTDLGFPRRVTAGDNTTYDFVAWTNTPDEKIFTDDTEREYFYPGETAAAGIEDNHLYATWRVIELTTLTVNKVWNDSSNADGSRPDSVTIRVLADGVEEARVTLSAENSWTHTFTGLDASKTYSVQEVNVPAGYTASYSESGTVFTVANAHTPVTPPTPTPTPTPPTPTPIPPTPWFPIPILTTTTTTTTTPATPTATEQVPAMPPAGDPNDIPAPLPVAAEAPAVLGVARRTTAMEPVAAQVRNYDEPAVLGSRRGKTGEGSDAQKAMTILAAGMIAVALSKDKRKKYR